jgi:hypothetical protein
VKVLEFSRTCRNAAMTSNQCGFVIFSIGHQLMGIFEEKPENVSLDVFRDEKLSNESLLYFDYLSHS